MFWNFIDRSFMLALIFIWLGSFGKAPAMAWILTVLGQKKAWPTTPKNPRNKLLVSVILAVEATFWLCVTENLFRYRFWIFVQVCSSIRVCQCGSRRRARASVMSCVTQQRGLLSLKVPGSSCWWQAACLGEGVTTNAACLLLTGTRAHRK